MGEPDNSSPRFTSIKETKKRSDKSPMRAKLDQYEYESDHIDDPTPVKNKPNEYKPVDYRGTKYFESERSDNEEFLEKHQNSKKSFDKKSSHKKDLRERKRSPGNIRDTKELVR